jgi:AcrR family transcriptional regulator
MQLGSKARATARKNARASVRARRADLYRSVVLEAAERVFAERGFADARMQEIAAAAGLSLATLYGVFPGKAELFDAIHERRGRELLEHAARVDSGLGLRKALLAGVRGYVGYLIEHPAFLRMQLHDGAAWAMPEPTFRSQAQRAAWTEGIRRMAELLREGSAAGEFVAEDPTVMAKTMIAMHQVALADWIERGGGESREALLGRIVAQVERAFCRPERARKR